MEKSELSAVIMPPLPGSPEAWTVEAIDEDGGVEVTSFTGPRCQERAIDYATARYAGFYFAPSPRRA